MEKTRLYIDNNVWDILYKNNIDLSEALPNNQFSLAITREAQFEIDSIPNKNIRDFANRQIEKYQIRIDNIFGFYNPDIPREMQRVSGFGSEEDPKSGGRLMREEEAKVIHDEACRQIGKTPPMRPTGLFKHEADTALAARATHSVVLTCNIKDALKRANKNPGSRVIDMKLYNPGNSLYEFIVSELEKFNRQK